MLDPTKFWVERSEPPIYKIQQEQQVLTTKIVQTSFKTAILPGCMAGESLLSQIARQVFLSFTGK